MRIAFVDFTRWDYAPDAPQQQPLGGSQSALCYLSQALAALGHDVFLLNHTTRQGAAGGVLYFPLSSPAAARVLGQCQVAVLQNAAKPARELRPLLAQGGRLVLWTQHAHDQPAMQPLRQPDVHALFDAVALVSRWQRDQYVGQFGLDPARCAVLRNAAGPNFERLFAHGTAAAAAKTWPPLLAYTSTPFRGLDLLLDAFPAIRQAVPGTRLLVCSSMQVYHQSAQQDAADYGHLYRRCQELEGVEYVGSLAQPALADRLRPVTLLAYPNHFAETSCIAVIEALAAGLRVLSSDLGALAETAGGFAELLPVDGDWPGYVARFKLAATRRLESIASDPAGASEHLERQLEFVHGEYTWALRARQWSQWLEQLVPASG